ncbi:hypothetical protein D3C72_627190 [compost metagenome]
MHADLPVADRHALGLAGGARGIDQVRQVGVVHHHLRGIGRQAGDSQKVQLHAVLHPGKTLAQAAAGHQQVHGRILDNPLQAILRVVDIQRHIGGAGFHHRQECHDHLHRAFQGDADRNLRSRPQGNQVVCQAIGTLIQLGVAQLSLATDYRNCLWPHLGMPGNQLGQPWHGLLAWLQAVASLGLLRLRRGQHVQAAHGGVRVVEHALEQPFETATNAVGGLLREAVAQVEELDRERLAQMHRQVHGVVGHVAVAHLTELQRATTTFLQAFVHRVVLEHHDAVEQRLPGLPCPALHIGQGCMFVVAQFQVAGLQLLQPVDNPLLRLGRLHHRQGVDEQTQHFVGTGQAGWPARHGGAEAHRGLPGIALQQQQPGRLDQGVWGDAQALGLLAQLPGTRGIPT